MAHPDRIDAPDLLPPAHGEKTGIEYPPGALIGFEGQLLLRDGWQGDERGEGDHGPRPDE